VDPGQAVRLIYGLVRGVGLLQHKLQVAHGDIQPANVVITSHPSRLVLIDFGSVWTIQTAASRIIFPCCQASWKVIRLDRSSVRYRNLCSRQALWIFGRR
jgi:serine/threonine protein kinase